MSRINLRWFVSFVYLHCFQINFYGAAHNFMPIEVERTLNPFLITELHERKPLFQLNLHYIATVPE